MKKIFALSIAVLAGASARAPAQQATPAQAPPAAPSLAQIGMFIYPAQGKSPEQQQSDEQACTDWAEAQTGLTLQSGSVDTQAAAASAEAQAAEATQGAAVAGAAKGAVAGVAIGAIAGDAGKGAAIGAVAGAIGGRRGRKHAEAQAAQQGAAQAQAQADQSMETFKKAAAACLQGRGYTVN